MSTPKITNPTLSPEQRSNLLSMRSRMSHIQMFGSGPSGKPLNEHLLAEIDAVLTDETPIADKVKALKEASRDKSLQSSLNALRIETVQNFVLASANFASFFEVVTLGEADVPAIQNETREEIALSYIAQDGAPRYHKVVKPQSEVMVDLRTITTDKATYALRDIYRGRVGDLAQRTFDLAYEVKMEMNAILQALLVTGLGSFNLTGNKAARTFVPHRRIRSGVLPTTNELTIPSVGAGTAFTFTTLNAIIEYTSRFAGAFGDGDLMPTGEIIVPADQIIGIVGGITPTTAKSSEITEELLRNGFYETQYLGKSWRFIPDNTIPRGYAWPRLNKPVGKLFLKPSMDVAGVETDEHANKESRWQSMVMGAAIPGPRRVNVARVEFNTTH